MVNDPRDARAYQIGIAFLGLAVVAVIAGVGWVVVEHQCVGNIPNELWFGAAAIIGVFVGAMIHLPFPGPGSARGCGAWQTTIVALGVVFLAAGCGALVVAEAQSSSLAWCGLGATVGGVLLGLLIPSPGRRDG